MPEGIHNIELPPRQCPICKIWLDPKQANQVYCGDKCRSRAHTIRKRETGWSRKYENERTRRARIGLHIKSEALMQPVRINKSLWDGLGRWSLKFLECVECGRTTYKHQAWGMCTFCYEQMRRVDRANDPEYLAKKRKIDKRHNRTTVFRKEGMSWIKRAQSGEVEQTPKINNLLNNL